MYLTGWNLRWKAKRSAFFVWLSRTKVDARILNYEIVGLFLVNLLALTSTVLTMSIDLIEFESYFFFIPSIALYGVFRIIYPIANARGASFAIVCLLTVGVLHMLATNVLFIPVSTFVTGESLLIAASAATFRYLDAFSYLSDEIEHTCEEAERTSQTTIESCRMLYDETQMWARLSLTACIYGYVIVSSAFTVLWSTGRTPLDIYLLAWIIILLGYTLVGAFQWIVRPLLHHMKSIRSFLRGHKDS